MPRTLRYFVVDAFTSRPFGGNPAAVVPLEAWLDDALLQQIAAEMNLSETAFFVHEPRDRDGFHLRWMTPTTEVDLCGHATLASAFALMQHVEPVRRDVHFWTRSGTLDVRRDGDEFALDLPARIATRVEDRALVAAAGDALGAAPHELWSAKNLMAVYDDATVVRALAPDFRKVLALPTEGVIVTAPGTGEDVDFVSRYFTPQHGIDEDPVTGSAHCTLGPYWAARLGRPALTARQISRRGGELTVAVVPAAAAGPTARVRLGGRAVLVARGELLLP